MLRVRRRAFYSGQVRDTEIRGALEDDLRATFPGDLVRSEVGLCVGACRVDVMVVNGHLHGYEIKSEHDTLARLDAQVGYYSRVLDFATVVSSGRHADRVRDRVPDWWGIRVAHPAGDAVRFEDVHPPSPNPGQSLLAVAQLLWRDEAAEALRALGTVVRSRETRWELWDRLAALPMAELGPIVRMRLKERPQWRGGG